MPKTTPSEQHSPSCEAAILEAAETLFADKGFDGVSMSAIAKRANTSKPNIYHHFSSKNDLYLTVMKTAAQRSSVLLDTLAASTDSYQRRLVSFAAGELDNILEHKNSTQLIMREALSGGSKRGREIAELVVGESFARLVAMFKQGQQANELRRETDPALGAFLIIAANIMFFQASSVLRYMPDVHFNDDPKDFTRGVMDILFNGIGQGEGS